MKYAAQGLLIQGWLLALVVPAEDQSDTLTFGQQHDGGL